jgi:hypothetical protein
MERPADTTVYRLVHRAMVASAERLTRLVEPAADPDARDRWTAAFVAEVRWHQGDEDTHAFPDLVERVPAAASFIGRLAADHRELDDLLDQLEHGQVTVAGRLYDLLAALTFDEDVNIAPLIERHLSYDEYRSQLVAAAERMPDELAEWAVPWLLAACAPEERPLVGAVLPERARLRADELSARYDELDRAAFGD